MRKLRFLMSDGLFTAYKHEPNWRKAYTNFNDFNAGLYQKSHDDFSIVA